MLGNLHRSGPPVLSTPRLRAGFLHLLGGSLVGRALGFGFNLLLSRALGPGNLGVVNLILSTTQTVEMTVRSGVDFGLAYALTGKGALLSPQRQGEIAHTALRVVQVSTLLAGLAVWLWVMPAHGLLPSKLPLDRAALATALLTISSLESLGTVQWDLLLIRGRTRALALRQGLFAPLKMLAAWLGAVATGLAGALSGYALAVAAQALWLWRIGRGLLPWPAQGHFDRATALSLMRQGGPQYLTNLLSTLVFLPLLAGVARNAGLADVGYLRVGQILVQLFTLLPGALVPVLFVRLRSGNDFQQRMRDTESSLRALWWSGLLCLVLYLLVDRWLLPLFFGRSFLPALQATRVLVLGAIGESVGQVLHQPLLASRRTRLFLLIQNSGAVAAAIGGALLVPRIGVGGFLAAKLLFGLVPLVGYFATACRSFAEAAPLWRLLALTLALIPLCWLPTGQGPAGTVETAGVVGILVVLALDGWSLRHWLRREVGGG